jgi:C4-dicarboxylate-specific signal transduction histidine kinase
MLGEFKQGVSATMISLAATHYAGFLLVAEILFCILLLRSERLRAWADVVCCALLGAFIHFLLLQFAKVRAEEWEILSASILVLGFSVMGWSMNRIGGLPAQHESQLSDTSTHSTDEIRLANYSMHDERLKAMGAMSARFVHELSQPLSVMMLRIEEIKRARKNHDEKSLEKSMQNIEEQLRHMLQLSKALKEFASSDEQIQPGFVRLDEIFSLTQILCEAWTLAGDVEIRWPSQVPDIEVSGGCTLHAQVLMNLLKNAVDAVSALPEKTPRWVQVDILERGGDVEIAVANAGLPIHRNVQSRLFKPFFSTKRMGHGLGLGLSICQQLVHSLGGEIWYDARASHPRFVVRYSFLPSVQGLVAESASKTNIQSVA